MKPLIRQSSLASRHFLLLRFIFKTCRENLRSPISDSVFRCYETVAVRLPRKKLPVLIGRL